MKHLLALSVFVGLLVAHALHGRAAEPQFQVESTQGNAEFDTRTSTASSTNGLIIRYEDAVLTADTGTLNLATGEVIARGNITLSRQGQVWHGDALQYNFRTRTMSAEGLRIGLAPVFGSARTVSGNQTTSNYVGRGVYVTTDDAAEPGYRVRASRMTVIPGDRIEMRNATVMVGEVPVFFWPYFRHSLKQQDPFNFDLVPGYRSRYGPYLHGTVNMPWNTNFTSQVQMDYRLRRGPGIGPSVQYDLGAAGRGSFDYYYLWDDDPGTNVVNGTSIPDQRQRFRLHHEVTLDTNLVARLFLNYQSDPQVLRDFYEGEFRRNQQPPSFLELSKFWPNFSLSTVAQPQINYFFETVERLPDVKLSAARQQIGSIPLYYEGENSLGYLRYATNNTPRYAAWRGDSFHQLLAPQTLFGWLNVTPRAGGRFTHYSEEEGRAATLTEQNRWLFNTGAEVSFKASRVWADATNSLLAVSGLRHILEPAVNYAYVPRPDVRPMDIPQFDTTLPSIRPLPVDFPRFNNIDSIDSENTLRLGLRNKFQTRRDGQIENLVDWDAFVDWRLRPDAGQQTFGDFVSVFEFHPRTWITFNSDVRYGINTGLIREANHELFIQPDPNWSLALGHRYFRQDPAYGVDSSVNAITSRFFLRLNENWAIRVAHRFEARDGLLEEQLYTLYRDLRAWTAGLSLRIRDDRITGTDLTVALTLSLKAFPRYGLGRDRDEATTLLGY